MSKKLGQIQKEAWGAFLIGYAAITRRIDRSMQSEGFLSLQVYDVLLALEDAPGRRMRMGDLANSLVFDASSLTRLVDKLEVQGYVVRCAHPHDRRSVFATLTAAGLAERERSWPRYRELIQEHFGRFFTDRCAAEFRDALNRARTLDGMIHCKRREPEYSMENGR